MAVCLRSESKMGNPSNLLESICNRRVLITIIPKLNSIQVEKLKQIVLELERNENKVLIIAPNNSESFDNRHKVSKCQRRISLLHVKESIAIIFSIKWIVWFVRIKRWASLGNLNAFRFLIRRVRESINIFHRYQPNIAFIWNTTCCQYGILHDYLVKKGVNTFQIEHGPIKNSIIIDKGYMFGVSSVCRFNAESIAEYEMIGYDVLKELQDANFTNQLYSQESAKVPKAYIENQGKINILVLGLSEVDAGVYPSWFNKDRKVFYKFHKNGLDQARQIARLSNSYQVIFKPHPNHNPHNINKRVLDNLYIVNGNYDNLLKWCDVVIANGTKAEIDVIINDKPMVNISNGLLYFSGASYVVDHLSELKSVIDTAKSKGVTANQLRNFIKFLGYIKANLI